MFVSLILFYKVRNGCVGNKDGTYDMNITLYFTPQSYMYLGLIISGATLVLIIGFLAFVFGKYLYEKDK